MIKYFTKQNILLFVFGIAFLLPILYFCEDYISLRHYYFKNFGELNLYYEDELSLLTGVAGLTSAIYYPILTILFFVLRSILKKKEQV